MVDSLSVAKTIDSVESLNQLQEQAYREICANGPDAQLEFVQNYASVYDEKVRTFIPAMNVQVALYAHEVGRYANGGSADILELGGLTSVISSDIMRLSKNITITFVESSELILDICRWRFADAEERVGFVKQKLTHFLQPDSFSIVRLGYSLSGYPDEDKRTILKHAFTSLKKGGMIFVQEFAWRADPELNAFSQKLSTKLIDAMGINGKLYQNYMHLSTDTELASMLADAGFVKIIRPFDCLNFVNFFAHKPV